MKKLTTFLLTIIVPFLSVNAATGTWRSTTTGTDIAYKTTEAENPAKDSAGKLMTVVYLENLACEKIGQNSNAENVEWLLSQGYRVIELDYAGNAQAVSPYINKDIISINSELNKGTFCGCSNISTDRAYVLFEGYRLQRDVYYYKDDPTIYNLPDAYAKTEGDLLYMDIAYPANPSRPVPTILSFSYSNSYSGKEHKRMFLGYAWGMFSDTFMEGAPAVGVAWAIADHPKYCDWGNGKCLGGPNKGLSSVEVNPDAARKVRSAIRTVRGVGKTLGLGNDVMIYGFSRGSTAGSLAIGDAPFADWTATERGRFPEESSEVQGAFLGPGVFDYSKMPSSSREYTNMDAYTKFAVGKGWYGNVGDAWAEQGGACAIKTKACPCFLFYNSNDDAYYGTQMGNLMSLLDKTNTPYELLKDFGNGHAVPQTTDDLARMYQFLKDKCIATPSGIKSVNKKKKRKHHAYVSPDGRTSDMQRDGYMLVADGRKYVVR